MTTTFPSPRTKELYAVIKGRRSLVEAGLQTAENEAFLQSPRGRRAKKVFDSEAGLIAGLIFVPFSAATILVFGAAGIEMLEAGLTGAEIVSAGAGAGFLGGAFCLVRREMRMEDDFAKAQPQDPHELLFKSIKSDLESINFSVLASDQRGLSFTTQRGVVVAGENEEGELMMLLNGLPMRSSYEQIAPAPKAFITSVTGQKIPVGSGVAAI